MSTGGKGHAHRFDPVSGWCHFCNLRDDGRLIGSGPLLGRGGDVYRAGTTSDQQAKEHSA